MRYTKGCMVHQILDLRHHKHTAKYLPRHHTSYRGIALVLAVLGFSLLFVSATSAADYTVSATVPAAVPSVAAQITSPSSGATLSTKDMTVYGTCQVLHPAAIVQIWNQSGLIGTVACGVGGTFQLPVQLAEGDNSLTPKQVTITGDPGPDGGSVIVHYVPPVVPATSTIPAITPQTPATDVAPLELSFEDSFLLFIPKKETTLVLRINGGVAPYTVDVDWGDTSKASVLYDTSGQKQLQHTYNVANSFTAVISVRDVAGHQVTKAQAVVTGAKSTVKVPSSVAIAQSPAMSVGRVVWNSYFAVTFGVVVLWAAGFATGKEAALAVVWHNLFRK